MQFYSDIDTDHLAADVGLPPFEYGSNTVICPEENLAQATKDWRIGSHELDPTKILDLGGTTGCSYIAYWHDKNLGPGPDIGASALRGHDPIGYIFVSDLKVTPEPSSLVFVGTPIIFLVSCGRKGFQSRPTPTSPKRS